MDWQEQVRDSVRARQFGVARNIVERRLAEAPGDLEARGWHARLLGWSDRLAEAEREYRELLVAVPNDADYLEGLAAVLAREQCYTEALELLNRALLLSPPRADLRVARGRVLRALGRGQQARADFQEALALDQANQEARAGLASLRGERRHELRVGSDTDWFNFAGANSAETLSWTSRWNARWTTSHSSNFYQRFGLHASKFTGSLTAHSNRWGALTIGGARGRDEGIIPRAEAFWGYGRGFRISETRFVRGLEAGYSQHWFWFEGARVLTLSGSALVYLPRDWTWSFTLTGARSQFPGTGTDWQPAGNARLNFPLAGLGGRPLSGYVIFGVGTESFSRVDQIGRFSSQTYGGGARFQMNHRQDVTGYVGYQNRTQGRTQTSFGLSYGFRF